MRRLIVLLMVLALLPVMAQAQDFIRYYPPQSNSAGNGFVGTSGGAQLQWDAANVLALRNGGTAGATVPQVFNLYNFCDGAACVTGYERGELSWSAIPGALSLRMASAGTGSAKYLYIGSGFFYTAMLSSLYPYLTDTYDIGSATPLSFRSFFLARSIQGSKSKALTDNTATAFVRLTVADDDYEGCGVIYTAFAEDTATDARQTRTGKVYAAILNNSGTEAVAFSTGDSAVSVTAGTLTCTFDGNSGAADTIDLRATCDTSLAATTTLTFEYRLDCPSTVTVTPQ